MTHDGEQTIFRTVSPLLCGQRFAQPVFGPASCRGDGTDDDAYDGEDHQTERVIRTDVQRLRRGKAAPATNSTAIA